MSRQSIENWGATAMNFDLASLFPDLEALTPDGRWNVLQHWLKENPEYGEHIEEWSKQNVDQVFAGIRDLIATRFGVSSNIISLLTIGKEQQIKRTIELLQACYRERQAYDNQPTEKEIKNVRTRRIHKKNARSDS